MFARNAADGFFSTASINGLMALVSNREQLLQGYPYVALSIIDNNLEDRGL